MIAIRRAHSWECDAISSIAHANRQALGFIPRSWLAEAVRKREVIVAVDSESVVGFARFHITRKGQCTLYEIAVRDDARGKGVGRALIEELARIASAHGASHILAKCPEGLPANGFYVHLGFERQATERRKKRTLLVWVRKLSD